MGGLLWCTDALDVAKGPLKNTDLNETCPHCCNKLAEEERSRWNLHVVSHFLIRGVGEALRHGDVPQGLEHHHCDRSSRENVRDNILCEHVQTDLNILMDC